MSVTITCKTKFDISFTGVKSHYHKSRMPFVDRTGTTIGNDQEWQRSRNKQTNWETVNQLISLRILPENISDSKYDPSTQLWEFNFDVPGYDKFGVKELIESIKSDAAGIPMIVGLDELLQTVPVLAVSGVDCNIWFEVFER